MLSFVLLSIEPSVVLDFSIAIFVFCAIAVGISRGECILLVSSVKNNYVRAEWLRLSGRSPSELA